MFLMLRGDRLSLLNELGEAGATWDLSNLASGDVKHGRYGDERDP
jgi:hypothetical protein